MAGKSFVSFKQWLSNINNAEKTIANLVREVMLHFVAMFIKAEEIKTIDQLMKLKNEAKILDIEYVSKNNKIYFRYKEENKEKRVWLSVTENLTKEQEAELQSMKENTIVELRKWILSHRKSLGININIDEMLLKSISNLFNWFNDKEIEEIEYYQDKEGNNKIIVYQGRIGYVVPVSNELSVDQLKEINDMPKQSKKLTDLRTWILSHRKSLGIDIDVDEKLITKEEELLDSDAIKIESTEYYQDKEGNNKIIVYCNISYAIRGLILPVSKEGLSEEQQKEIKAAKTLADLKDWIHQNLKDTQISEKISGNNNRLEINLDKIKKKNNVFFREILYLESDKIGIKDESKMENVYLDLRNGDFVYDYKHQISDFYKRNTGYLKEFMQENDIDTQDFFILCALNKAILEFRNKYGNKLSSAEDKENLKEYFFTNLFSIIDKRKTNEFINDFCKVKNIENIYSYNNYFFKLSTRHLIKNEYDFYNKVKEDITLNEQLGKNINKYYGWYDKKINNKKCKFVVSKNLQKDEFMDLSKYLTKNKIEEKQGIGIINKVLTIDELLEKEAGLYNYDLKPENVMMNDKGDIKLIDYEGMVPEDSTAVMSTARLWYDNSLIADGTLRSMYRDYVKFFGMILPALDYLYHNDNSQFKNDLNSLHDKFLKYNENNKNRVDNDKLILSGKELLKDFKSFCTKYSKYFENNNLKFSKNQLNNVEKLINIQAELFNEKSKDVTNNIRVLNDGKMTGDMLKSKLKNSIYIINSSVVINKLNKIVIADNKKFIKKREKGEPFNCVPWCHDKTNSIAKTPILENFMTYIKKREETVLQEIVDKLIPIDETNIFQQIVLGTLMKKFIDANHNNNNDEEYYKELCEKLKNEKDREKYFGKKALKEVFMEIIKDDKTFLDLFFDFNNECELIKVSDDKFKLRFFSLELEFDLDKTEADNITKKFKVSAIDGNTHFGFKNNKLNFTDIKAEKESEGWSWNKTYFTYSISHKNTKLLSLPMKTKQIIIQNEKIKNVYLDLDKGCMVYDDENKIYNFYKYNNEFLEEFIQENNINTKDFFIRVSLNKAILDFINSETTYHLPRRKKS